MSPNWFIGLVPKQTSWLQQNFRVPPEDTRIFHPDDLHVTIIFLGQVSKERALRVWSSMDLWSTGPISSTLGEVQGFGNPKKPSAFSFTFEKGNDLMADEISRVRPVLEKIADIDPEKRPPLPHMTIARPTKKSKKGVRIQGLAQLKQTNLAGTPILFDEIALYTWSDNREKQLFAKVATKSLIALSHNS